MSKWIQAAWRRENGVVWDWNSRTMWYKYMVSGSNRSRNRLGKGWNKRFKWVLNVSRRLHLISGVTPTNELLYVLLVGWSRELFLQKKLKLRCWLGSQCACYSSSSIQDLHDIFGNAARKESIFSSLIPVVMLEVNVFFKKNSTFHPTHSLFQDLQNWLIKIWLYENLNE